MVLRGFCGPSYVSRSRLVAGEETINWYSAIIESEYAKSRRALWPCPGMKDFATLGDTKGRALFSERGQLFAIVGSTLYGISAAGAPANRGTVALDANPGSMSTNGDGGKQLFATSATKGYLLDLVTLAFTNPVNAVTMAGQLDGFFVALDAVTSTLKISESLDGTTWDPSQIAQRTSASDPWAAMRIFRKEIALLGTATGEIWWNPGNSPFPFAPRQGAFFEVGIEAPWSLSPFAGTIAWLGQSAKGSGIVYTLNGYSPERISNEAVEWAIATYRAAGDITDAIGWSYEALGHVFYILEFPTAGKSWVYDGTTREWHRRGLWTPALGDFAAYRPRFYANAFGKDLVLDGAGQKMYELSNTVYTDIGGASLRRLRRLPHISQENRRLFLDRFEVEAERGVGLAAGQGSDPLLALRVSWDGGQTYGNERTRSLGRQGAFSQRLSWEQCGSGRDLVIELSCSEPMPVNLFDGYAELS